MLALESKTAIAKGNQEAVFAYISDFRNFSGLLPAERLNDLEISKEEIRFKLQGLGTVGLIIEDKKPHSELTITATKDSSADFTFVFHILKSAHDQSEVKINLNANLNMFIEMVARSPLQQFLDMMADKISSVDF